LNLNFGGVLDQYDALMARDEFRQAVKQRRLAGSSATANRDRLLARCPEKPPFRGSARLICHCPRPASLHQALNPILGEMPAAAGLIGGLLNEEICTLLPRYLVVVTAWLMRARCSCTCCQ
jgi:hypothetical protein